jgi:hypothetical protein
MIILIFFSLISLSTHAFQSLASFQEASRGDRDGMLRHQSQFHHGDCPYPALRNRLRDVSRKSFMESGTALLWPEATAASAPSSFFSIQIPFQELGNKLAESRSRGVFHQWKHGMSGRSNEHGHGIDWCDLLNLFYPHPSW